MISVIIPAYNAARYICKAIDSVLAQTWTDFEIIVIDDGSSDNTHLLVQSRYPAVSCFRTVNKGVSHARNYGIAQARGSLIAFLDADDHWLPEKLEKQEALFKKDPSLGLVFTDNFFFDERGISPFTVNKKNRLMRGNVVRNIFLNSYVVTSTVMVRKSVFERVGLFEEGLSVAEDDNMWMRIGMNYGIALVDEKLVMYRMTVGSLSSDFTAVISGVERQIELMKTRYQALYTELGPLAIRKKYSEIYFNVGYRNFNQCDYKSSRASFFDSCRTYPLQVRSLLYLLSTYLPQQAIQFFRCIRRSAARHLA
ncbi:glycosyltransferase family A protein [Geobacter sp. SVR]|uniref:glycosyltransferase family 2 protein n=1 Tax=Geobacter sp. SVR TaxID=2495594 RepID=UPI00143EF901|nr:glycosyltransferase family A protein [Geobacter sp. SVR]BCS54962.1 hypothetical protein GSVR_32700 [Geobacter sp. SVR]GCF86161.1 hypothetical protein GSbR_27610 [Geobacter sp. SVR]